MNRKIREFICGQDSNLTRFEIDSLLLKAGYDPREIDETWQELEKNKTEKSPQEILYALLAFFVLIQGLGVIVFAIFQLIISISSGYLQRMELSYTITLILTRLAIAGLCFWSYSLVLHKSRDLSKVLITVGIASMILSIGGGDLMFWIGVLLLIEGLLVNKAQFPQAAKVTLGSWPRP